MTPDREELGGADDATAPATGGKRRSFMGKLPPISPFPRAKLVDVLRQLTRNIYELEGLVVGEDRSTQERDLSAALEPSREPRLSEKLPLFGGTEPMQTVPEASTTWGALAYHHVRQAQVALEDRDEAAFWHEFYAARRMELFGLDDLGDEYLEMQARSIALEAAGLSARNGLLRLDTPRKEAIENILGAFDDYRETAATPEAERAGGLTASQVGAAMHVLHEFYVDQRLTGRVLKLHLQSFIVIMSLSAITFIAAFLSIPLGTGQGVLDRIALLQSPLSGLVGLATLAQLIVLVLIVVLGIMGASVSGILSLSRELQRSRIPEQAGTVWFAVARLATGGVAALMVFLFLMSGLISLGGDPASGFLTLNLGAELSVALVFSLSFVAGFSERLLVRVVKSVSGDDSTAPGTTGLWP